MLAKSTGSGLEELLPEAEVSTARQMIDGLHESAKESVTNEIEAHKIVWGGMSEDERKDAQQRAGQWATRNRGHRVACPSCGTTALLFGDASGPVERHLRDREIVARQKCCQESLSAKHAG